MKFEPLRVHGSFLVMPEPHADDRGSFARIWDEAEFAAHGIEIRNVQTNLSTNRQRGTIRGLHWQAEPHGETKFLRCTRGSVYDVAVDLRPDSPTYLRWQGVTLTAAGREMAFVPAGCAHGYQALEDGAEVTYQVSHVYTPSAERGLRWDDPDLGIEWPITEDVIVSPKDAAWPALAVLLGAEEAVA